MAKRMTIGELVQRLDSQDERIAGEAGNELMEKLESEELTENEVAPFAAQIMAAFNARRAAVLGMQREGKDWMWADDYIVRRDETELLLDLLGYVPTPEALALLRGALEFRDPLLKFWATVSLLRRGQPIDPAQLRELAADPITRNRLYFLLEETAQTGLFTAEFATQEAFATSDMVSWLAEPNELGSQPDEIELMQVVSMDFGEEYGTGDYYVFRFRTAPPHWAAEQEWMSGVSGPFLRKEEPTPHAYGYTFSSFRPWGEMTPEELVSEMQELFGEMEESEDDDEEKPE